MWHLHPKNHNGNPWQEQTMTKGTFEKVQRSDKLLYGPRKLLLCGFPGQAQRKFGKVLKMAGLDDIAVVYALQSHAGRTLGELLELPDGAGEGQNSTLPRAIIVSGITENQLHTLMVVCRKTGMQQNLWAALTPTSETWALQDLLKELQTERKALAKRNRK
jgi:hypothetical protein